MDFSQASGRTVMMLNKLMIEVNNDRIDNDWAETFIRDMHKKCKAGQQFSTIQINKLEELFDKY